MMNTTPTMLSVSGEDISETDTRSSGMIMVMSIDSEFIDDDDDFEIFSPLEVKNSGVVIEEILNDEEPASQNDDSKSLKKKSQASVQEGENTARQEIILKKVCCFSVFESEDEDGLPISPPPKSKARAHKSHALEEHHIEKDEVTKEETEDSVEGADIDDVTCKKRKNKSRQLLREKKKKKKRNQEEGDRDIDNNQADDGVHVNNLPMVEAHHPQEVANQNSVAADEIGVRGPDPSDGSVQMENLCDGKKKKKKKKPSISTCSEMPTALSSHVRTYPNGLAVEELAMGEADGKRACRGKQVSVSYIGRLMETGKVFYSNEGRAPYKFRLGVGQVIKGWDVGVVGMRIGDKRRVKIPPSMGYGDKGASDKVPPNSWLEFDIELIDVH